MCTVTIIPIPDEGGIIRLACNRDESRERPAAQPPTIQTVGQGRAVLPIDPISNGTWIAANDAGIAATLLNAYPEPERNDEEAAASGKGSRGQLIPSLMRCTDLAEAVELASEIDATRYDAFRLILLTATHVAEVYTDGRNLRSTLPQRLTGPMLFASSGLGDENVDVPRRALFNEMLASSADLRDFQDRYHQHSWPDRPHLSVCMRRPRVQTISYCVVELGRRQIEMVYYPLPPDQPSTPARMSLPLR
jgi:uncharacterized protein with NRDE domain